GWGGRGRRSRRRPRGVGCAGGRPARGWGPAVRGEPVDGCASRRTSRGRSTSRSRQARRVCDRAPAVRGEPMIDRWTPLRFVFVGVLLFTPFWRWFYAARLPWLYLVVLACALAFFATPLVREGARWWGVLDVPSARKVHVT